MSTDRRKYVPELEEIAEQIDYWEKELETDDIPGFRDPISYKEDKENIKKYQKQFYDLERRYEAEGRQIYAS